MVFEVQAATPEQERAAEDATPVIVNGGFEATSRGIGSAYVDGPQASVASQTTCRREYGSLAEIRRQCSMDPACRWLLNRDCDSRQWRSRRALVLTVTF